MTVGELARIAAEAKLVEDQFREQVEREIDEATREIERKHRDRKMELATARWKAYKAWQAEDDRLAVAKALANPPLPLGTVFEQVRTGKKAILELVMDRNPDQFPENLHHSTPNPGSFIIRILKSDGTPGKPFVEYNKVWAHQWKLVKEVR